MIERILQPTGTERRLESKVWLFIASDPLSAFRQLFEAQGLVYVLSGSTLKAPTFCPQSVFISLDVLRGISSGFFFSEICLENSTLI
jgi:hypothetical protein